MLVQVRICLSNSFETPVVSNRGKGGLTGSRVALALAQIPIEHLLFEFADRWRSRSFEKKVSCGSWIDNLYWVGNNPLETISMAEDASTFLKSVWGLDVKQGSRVYMASLGHSQIPDDCDSLALWKRDETFRVLGHILMSSGSNDACIKLALSNAWKAFWAKVGGSRASKVPVRFKLGQIEKCVKPILSFRWVRWSFTATTARRLDRVQRHMIRCCVRPRKLSNESPASFAVRANILVSEAQRRAVPWSSVWAKSLFKWAEHIQRNTANACWSTRVLDVRPSSEVNSLRAFHGGRPQTRALSGFCSRRWTDGVHAAWIFLDKTDPFPFADF